MFTLQIIVYLNQQAYSTGSKVFERTITCPSDLSVDYVVLSKALHILFGMQAVVSFIIIPK